MKNMQDVEIKKNEKISQKKYTYEEVLNRTLKYFNDEELPTNVWMTKYAMKDNDGNFVELIPSDMHHRMAKEFESIEEHYRNNNKINGSFNNLSEYGQQRSFLNKEKIFSYFDNFKYIVPQGSVMQVLGNKYMIGSLSNCIVVPEIYDSYGGILYTDQQLTQLMKRRCGVGADISTLRPNKSKVTNAAGTSTGPVSFMERFSNTTREVAQSGRRGALMLTIDIAHPDAEDFVEIKQDLSKVTGANISLRISDEFMESVVNDTEYNHRWPIESKSPITTKTIKAKDLWNKIIKCAHNTAEPGLIFWDRQHKYSTSSLYPFYKNVSTNPCSEIAMGGGDSCRLIALNLFGCVINPFTDNAKFDYKKFYEVTYEAQRLMDDLVELELKYIEKIIQKIKDDKEPDYIKSVEIKTWELLHETGLKGRRTGLGFTALADTIASLGMKFDSDESMKTVEKIMRTKLQAEFDSSIDMSIERGKFDGFDTEIEEKSEFVQMIKKEFKSLYDRMMKFGRRNVSISTVAPTGSLSILTQTSSGIEPVYAASYIRRKKINPNDKDAKVDFIDSKGDKWTEFTIYHPKIKEWMKATGKTDISESPYYKSSAPEIDWIKRVEMQSIIQKYITHSISSTINLPNDVPIEKVGEIYIQSWKLGLKGITVYRDGSRSGVLVTEKTKDDSNKIIKTNAPKRPKELNCDIHHITADGEKWLVIVGLLDNDPYELFAFRPQVKGIHLPIRMKSGKLTRVKSGMYNLEVDDIVFENISSTIETDDQESITRLISSSLRHGVEPEFIIDQLSKAPGSIVSFSKSISRSLKKYIKDHKIKKKCEGCGSESVIFENGCYSCRDCGNSKCS